MLGSSPVTVGLRRVRLQTRARKTHGDIVRPQRSNQSFQRPEWTKLPQTWGRAGNDIRRLHLSTNAPSSPVPWVQKEWLHAPRGSPTPRP